MQFPQARNTPALAGVLSGFESGWSRALTAALVIGALFIVLAALVLLQNRTPAPPVQLAGNSTLTDYGQAIQVQFNTPVNSVDAKNHTRVYKLSGGITTDDPNKSVDVNPTWQEHTPGGILILKPKPTWEPGATYEVDVAAANISVGIGNDRLGKEDIKLQFTTMANTPTPTSSPTDTPTPLPTETPLPPTEQPTAIAENTAVPTAGVPGIEPSSTPVEVASATPLPTDTATPRPNPTSTPVPPTATPVLPTSTPVPPSATPTLEPTTTPVPPTATPTPHSGTPTPKVTATPRPSSGTPTPRPPCNLMPVNGFGKIWDEHSDIRDRVGCPVEHENAIQSAAGEQFQGGYMFWRGDTQTIYVFFWGSPNDTVGTWQQFPDTWKDGDPEPTPDQPAPTGLYIPVRGFGKIWNENSNIRQGARLRHQVRAKPYRRMAGLPARLRPLDKRQSDPVHVQRQRHHQHLHALRGYLRHAHGYARPIRGCRGAPLPGVGGVPETSPLIFHEHAPSRILETKRGPADPLLVSSIALDAQLEA